MKRLLSYLFLVLGLGLIFSGSVFAVPKILKSKVLEVCIVSEDVTIFQKYQETTPGRWFKGATIALKKGQVLSVHGKKNQTNIPRWYATEKDYFPKKNTYFHKATIDSDYGVKKIKDVIHCKKGDKESLKSIKASIKKKGINGTLRVPTTEKCNSFTKDDANWYFNNCDQLKFGSQLILDDTDQNIEKLYRNILTSDKFLKKNKYLKLSKKKKISGKKNEIIVLAVYFNYENELLRLTNNPEINDIDVRAWSWVSSNRNLDWKEIYGYAMGSLNTKAAAKCYKKALKLKLEGGECIIVDARKPTGSWDPPTINKNLLFHERESRTLKNGFKSQYLINKIAEKSKVIEDQKKQKLAEKKKKEKEKQLLAEKKKKEKEKQILAEKKKKEKEKQLLAEKKKKEKEKQILVKKKETQKLERKKKILSLFNESELEKSQKIINYTKEFVEIYPDEFDILQIAKKILAVKSISEGVINQSNLKKLIELQKFTSKSEKFKTYEIQIIKKEKAKNTELANIEIEKLDKKIKESKIYLSKNIDNKYAEDLIDLISKAEKTFLDLSSLDEIQKRNSDLDLLISKIDTLNDKINISKEINILLKEKLKKSLSSKLAPSLIELIENFENALDNIDIAYLDKLIQEANVFIDEELSVDSSKSTSVEENKPSKIKNEDDSDKKEKNVKKISKDNKSDYLKLPNSKYLTVDAFKRIFDKKTLVVKYARGTPYYGRELMFVANVEEFTKATTKKENGGVITDIYAKINDNWLLQGQFSLHYIEDATICDHTSRKTCKKGAIIIFDRNIFKNPLAIIKLKEKYNFVQVDYLSEGHSQHIPGEYVVISPDRSHIINFEVVELTDEDKISKQKAKDIAKQKKNEVAKSKQAGFKKKITLSCTYVTEVGMRTETYRFEGHDVNWNGIPLELGVESNKVLITRESANIVKGDIDGMVFTVNLKKQTAMFEAFGQIVTAQCVEF